MLQIKLVSLNKMCICYIEWAVFLKKKNSICFDSSFIQSWVYVLYFFFYTKHWAQALLLVLKFRSTIFFFYVWNKIKVWKILSFGLWRRVSLIRIYVTFRSNVSSPSSSWSSCKSRNERLQLCLPVVYLLSLLLDLEDGSITFLRNVR